MRIFASWSGETAKAVALLLREWLPSVLQLIDEVWVSDVDIDSGANWSATIGSNLESCTYGIICVTPENQDRPWLNFEAGAVSKLLYNAVPLLINFADKSDLHGGPMSQLQVRETDEPDMKKLVTDINARLSKPLTKDQLDTAFGRAYKDFETQLMKIILDKSAPMTPKLKPEKIDEVLTIVRELRNRQVAPRFTRLRGTQGLPTIEESLAVDRRVPGSTEVAMTPNAHDPQMVATEVVSLILRQLGLDLSTMGVMMVDRGTVRIYVPHSVSSRVPARVRAALKATLPGEPLVDFYSNRDGDLEIWDGDPDHFPPEDQELIDPPSDVDLMQHEGREPDED